MICKINELFNLSVLVVDDSVVVRKLLEDIISGLFNEKIDMAKDGLEAVEMMTKKEYDLVITDINMPRMDGVKLVKHIRSKGNEVPIFVISGESDKDYFIDLINEEVCGFIAKPFNSDTVQHHLRKICSMVSDKKLIAEYQEKLEERNIELDRINQELTRAWLLKTPSTQEQQIKHVYTLGHAYKNKWQQQQKLYQVKRIIMIHSIKVILMTFMILTKRSIIMHLDSLAILTHSLIVTSSIK